MRIVWNVLAGCFMLAFFVCWVGAAASSVRALGYRKPGVGWRNPNLWLELTPEGERLRNRAFKFWLAGVVAFALGWFAILLADPNTKW
jgi:hypothetical protein